MGTAAGESPEQEAVDGAAGQRPVLGPATAGGVVFQKPAEFGGGKVRIENQSGPGVQPRLVRRLLATEGGGATVLPDDRPTQRPAAVAFPDQDRLALVGDANAGELARLDASGLQRTRDDLADAGPDLLGIVFDPVRLRIMLCQLASGAARVRPAWS